MVSDRKDWEEARHTTRKVAFTGVALVILSAILWIFEGVTTRWSVINIVACSGFVAGTFAAVISWWMQDAITREHLSD